MANIQKLGDSSPHRIKLELDEIFFGQSTSEYDSVELIITIVDENINIKELSSYLDFIYEVDGNLSKFGFLSYSKMPRNQLEITQIKKGSWELIIEKLLNTVDSQNLFILFLILKYLPNVIQATLDGAHKYYETLNTREDYLEKKSKRKFRSPLKKAINEDDLFKNLQQKEKDNLYKLLKSFYKKRNLAASRFSQKYIKDIQIKPKKNSR